MEKRVNRELETREAKANKKSWQRPETLPTPKHPEPGYVYRWVRVSARGESDPTNVSSKSREGWVAVKQAECPEIPCDDVRDGRYADNIIIGGLMLCKMPQEIADERNAHYSGVTKSNEQAMEAQLDSVRDPRMPLIRQRSSRVSSFGNGN